MRKLRLPNRSRASYHFGGKVGLWKAAATDVFTKLENFTVIFSVAPEAKLVFDVQATDEDVVDRDANMMVGLLLSRSA